MSWVEYAACGGQQARMEGPATLDAKRLCRPCPCAEVCLWEAMEAEEPHRSLRFGIRGGLTPRQRDELRAAVAADVTDVAAEIRRRRAGELRWFATTDPGPETRRTA